MWPWPHPFQGWLVIGRLGLAVINLCTKFEVSNFTHYTDTKDAAIRVCRKWRALGWYRGHSRSLVMSPFDRAHDLLFVFNRNYASILYHFRDITSHLSQFADFTLPHLYSSPPLRVTPFEFLRDLSHQKTRFPGLSYGVVCVFLCLSLIHIWRCRRIERCRSRWSPYH